MNEKVKEISKEIVSLLYWGMLAACTVGPGTVVTCARSGAEQGLSLAWVLIFATILAFILTEGAVRLSVSCGISLGQCLRIKYRHTYKIYNVAIFCWIVAIAVYIGNTFFQVNCFAGGMDSIYSMPPDFNQTTLIQVTSCVGYAVVVSTLLLFGQTYHISIALGVLLVAMAILFLIVVIRIGIDWESFGRGLIPNFPEGSANLILSLVGTTSIGFNLFLGSSMAEDARTLGSAQRGIAFSVLGAFLISILIMIVGSSVEWDQSVPFSIQLMADLVEDTVGEVGLWFFSLGFMSAAFSSMLTVALGAAITTDSMFTSDNRRHKENKDPEDTKNDEKAIVTAMSEVSSKSSTTSLASSLSTISKANSDNFDQRLPRWIYHGIMISMNVISAVIISLQVDTAVIIQMAQVVNGTLLPLFAFCLLLCINDPTFMSRHPQKWWGNILLIVAVTITLILALNSIITNIFQSVLDGNEEIPLYVAAGSAPVIMILAIWATGVWRGIFDSFKRMRCCK